MKKIIAIFCFVAFCVVSFSYPVSAADIDYQYAHVTTQSGPLNMRETASTKAAKIDEIPKGEIITITSRDDTWCACLYNEKAGYVMTKFLSFIDVSQFKALKPNDSGQDILALKERLRELYFLDADAWVTERYDMATETAVKQFQAANGMEETGIASPELQAFLLLHQLLVQARRLDGTANLLAKYRVNLLSRWKLEHGDAEMFPLEGQRHDGVRAAVCGCRNPVGHELSSRERLVLDFYGNAIDQARQWHQHVQAVGRIHRDHGVLNGEARQLPDQHFLECLQLQ